MAENTRTINILGLDFTVPNRYAEGHTLSTLEASQLNKLICENVANNFRGTVRTAQEAKEGAPSLESLPGLFADYESKYTFSTPGASSIKLDPVEKEALKKAKEIVKDSLAQQGRKLTDIPEGKTKEEWEAALQAAYEDVATRENIRAWAKNVVKARTKDTGTELGNLGITLG